MIRSRQASAHLATVEGGEGGGGEHTRTSALCEDSDEDQQLQADPHAHLQGLPTWDTTKVSVDMQTVSRDTHFIMLSV